MNSTQFNIYLGICSILGFFLPAASILSLPTWLLIILALLLFAGDFWAFIFKLKFTRARYLYELSKGNPKAEVGQMLEPGCMMFYAFMMRMIFRFTLALFVILGGKDTDKELNGFQITLLSIVVLFELFNLMFSMYETHIFSTKIGDETEKANKESWLKEIEWRKKMFERLNDPSLFKKEMLANAILFVMAFFMTKIFWDGMNNTFIESIIHTKKFEDSYLVEIIGVLISCTILCFFFLMPVRLAFWIEDRMKAVTRKEKRNYRLSLFFAGISICSPTIIQMFISFGPQ